MNEEKTDLLKKLNIYREYPGINYSLLSKLSSNIKNLNVEYHSDAFTFGSMVDCLLFTPELEDELFIMWPKQYKISDAMKIYADSLIGAHKEVEEKEYVSIEEWKKEAKEKADFKISIEQIDKKMEGDGIDYINFVLSAGDKEIISLEEYEKAKALSLLVKFHPYSLQYFDKSDNDIELFYQYPVYGKIILPKSKQAEDTKILLDIVKINHKNKTIEFVDFKTIGAPVNQFSYNYFKFKYYYQEEWYFWNGHMYFMNIYPDYTILPFKFLVASNLSSYPASYIISKTEEDKAVLWYGGINNGYQIRGINELLEDLEYYRENGFEIERTVAENNGLLTIPFSLNK